MAYAFLYDDGSFVFTDKNTADPSKTLLASYPDWDTISFEDDGGPPWLTEDNYERVVNVLCDGVVSPTTMYYMFSGFVNLVSADLSGFDASNVTNMEGVFVGCTSLTSVEFGDFDTSNASIMESMFRDCSSVKSLDLSSFDTGKVSIMTTMFQFCTALTTIYVSEKWNMKSVVLSNNMFYRCTKLKGGNGTAYSSTNKTGTYAVIDTAETPGYFTYRQPRSDELLVTVGTMRDIAEAIRSKTGSTDSLTPSQMVAAIRGIGTS